MEEAEESLVHGLEQQARCLRSVVAQQDTVQFLIGTQSLRADNEVCVLDVEEDGVSASKSSYVHAAGEIWHLAAHPTELGVFASCHSAVREGKLCYGCTVWRLPADGAAAPSAAASGASANGSSKPHLEPVCAYACDDERNGRASDATLFEWEPSGSGTALLVHGQNKISTVDLKEAGSAFPALTATNWHEHLGGGDASRRSAGGRVHSAVWEPYPGSQCIVAAVDAAVRAYDLRANGPSYSVDNAHAPSVRCVDLNPNRPHVLVTGGDDGAIRLWDARKANAPLMTVAEHSHWVWSVRFNPIHDQLVLSASSDGLLILHSLASHCSDCVGVCAPPPSADDGRTAGARADTTAAGDTGGGGDAQDEDAWPSSRSSRLADGVLRKHDSHEESVYACDWSVADPWRYASLSYHGRVIVDNVATKLKYAILNVD